MARDDRRNERQGGYERDASVERREIGPVPNIADPDRRELCRDDLELFARTYNPAAFSLEWGPEQVRSIRRIQDVAIRGGLHAFAEARGSGKTARCRMAALWAVAYGHRRYSFIVGSTAEKARESLDALKTWMRFLPLFVADFPEIAFPVDRIGGIAQRAAGQLCLGASTLIEWGQNRVVLPTVPPPANWPAHWPLRADGMVPTGGTVIGCSGLTGEGIRGCLFSLPSGEMVRPDLVLLDDPQTSESARSPKQNRDRIALVSGDLLGLAGPGESLACVMPCTVIEPDDFADTLLDREKNPLWRGERSGILTAMPTNLDAWEKYFETYHEDAQKDPPDLAASNAYFLAHQAALTEGCEATWPARVGDGEVSPVQHAMHLYVRNKATFAAEYMNEPLRPEDSGDVRAIVAAEVATRINGCPRYVVPVEHSTVVAFFDPGAWLHWYAVCAFNDQFGGAVLDYGSWPRQSRVAFDSTDAHPRLRDKYPGYTDAQTVRHGLDDLTREVLDRTYRTQSGGEVRITKALVDAGHERDAVYDFVRASPHAGILVPSKGMARSITSRGVGAWKKRDGERAGHHWKQTAADKGKGVQIQFDPDAWKSIVYERLTIPLGGRSTLTLFGERVGSAFLHETIAAHFAAEYAKPARLHGVDFFKWVIRPNAVDNHWLDCTVGCAVAASVAGLHLPTAVDAPQPTPKPKRQKVSFAEMIEKREREGRQLTGAR